MTTSTFNNLFTYSYLTKDGFEECTLLQPIGKLPEKNN